MRLWSKPGRFRGASGSVVDGTLSPVSTLTPCHIALWCLVLRLGAYIPTTATLGCTGQWNVSGHDVRSGFGSVCTIWFGLLGICHGPGENMPQAAALERGTRGPDLEPSLDDPRQTRPSTGTPQTWEPEEGA